MITPPDKMLYGDSNSYKNWMSFLAPTTCLNCRALHGTVYPIDDPPYETNIHPRCRCILVPMRTKALGHVTENGFDGADVYIACLGKLPDDYVDKITAINNGWKKSKGNLQEVLPNATIGGDIYYNDDKKLPRSATSVWYEADINYSGGFRNQSRILYSNDGLIFVTYDHYQTFYEVLQ